MSDSLSANFKMLMEAARKADADAQYILSSCYFKGQGVAANPKKSLKWLSKAAEQGERRGINSSETFRAGMM